MEWLLASLEELGPAHREVWGRGLATQALRDLQEVDQAWLPVYLSMFSNISASADEKSGDS